LKFVQKCNDLETVEETRLAMYMYT